MTQTVKPVLILGKSGVGKSASLRNFKDEEVSIINVNNKPLPFRNEFKGVVNTRSYEDIEKLILNSQKKVIVVDDAGYLITDYFMKNHSRAGGGNGVFTLYNEIGDKFYHLLDFVRNLQSDKVVYFIMHEDYDERGGIKPKTIGKLLDEKVCIEGMFTIVLHAEIQDDKYVFCTKNHGTDATKAPMGMFEEEYIDNDLKMVTDTIREYYDMDEKKEEK